MAKGTIFWLLMIVWAIFGIAFGLLGFILFFLLGWQVFGFVIR
jgi:hypothetical protein